MGSTIYTEPSDERKKDLDTEKSMKVHNDLPSVKAEEKGSKKEDE